MTAQTANTYRDPGHSDLVQTVAANVRAEVARKGWTQAMLAAKLGVAPATVNLKWKGRREWALQEVGDLADLLGVAVTTLVARPEGFEPPTF